MIILKFKRTKKFLYEVDELRAISGHMLGASGVQIPKNNLDNMHSTVEDGTFEIMDPQELRCVTFYWNRFPKGTIAVVVMLVKGHTFPTNVKVHPVDLDFTRAFTELMNSSCDLLALVSKFTHVEESTCLLETTFVEDVVLKGLFPDEGICSVNLIVLLLFTGVMAISLVPKLLMQGQFFGVEGSLKTPAFHDDPLHESLNKYLTSQGPPLNMRQTHTSFESLGRWTKDHPISNVISDPSRSVLTRKQLQNNAMWCSGSDTLHKESRERLIIDTPLVEKTKLDEDLPEKPVDATLYRGMIGSLMYLTSSRPDLTYAVCFCAWYQAKPTKKHLNTVKQIFRYLKGTINMGLWYLKDTGDKLVSWSSKKKKCTAISRFHFIKEQVENGIMELYFIRTGYQLADIFTKPLPRERFIFLIEKLGIKRMSSDTLKRLAEETDE
uniref:Reverse transcriptase Ty1/copia-type domain-containing protein n=1 Tax=Tanacetum cinerariifolium TaxID=118510 RepID=A0A6L2JYC3_TANCI|nr:hypothetical protein [Tanacetum cinerariifolium]